MNNLSFALKNVSYDNYDIKKFTKAVKTKAWTKKHKRELSNYADRLTTAGVDDYKVIGGMLRIAFGENIGLQILEKLNNVDIQKIKYNIISLC